MWYLGIDVGSLFVGAVLVDGEGTILRRSYTRHQGEPVHCVRTTLEDFPLEKITRVVLTGSGAPRIPLKAERIDAIVSGVEGVKHLVPDAQNIIYVGGGSFSLTRLNPDGSYQRSTTNSACASGTGAFLDQQALRLQIPPTELAERAQRYGKKPPGVATRCAVFAKSDMIHLQQEGYSPEAIAAGLCAGLGHSTVDGLLSGHALDGKTAIIGGVARNAVVASAVTEKAGVETVVPEHPETVGAYGAALVARQHGASGQGRSLLDGELQAFVEADHEPDVLRREAEQAEQTYLRPPLELQLSDYPDFAVHDHWVNDDASEIAVIAPRSGTVRVSLGIDIGSTSTKAALLDEENAMVGWIYRKTAGDPIRAVQLLFQAVRDMESRGGFTLDIQGVGTTGSGRKMIGAVIGADLAMNEITAHARAAVFLDPQVDTILELGGQDAKFTQLQNGMVYNSIMNYVCAAGTGSFIEEQALKLDIPLGEYADRALGKACPKTSDRCTVYMERDLDLLLAKGWSKDQVAAAVLHSVRDNYLNKVVGGLHIGDHVYFQGATARNKAVVAAFEVELGKAIRVSPYCHVTGALGMCLLVRERVPAEKRSADFKGLAFADETVQVEYEQCELCHNLCSLSIIHVGDQTVAWGLKCGRDYGEQKVKVKKVVTYDWWKERDTLWRDKPEPAARDDGRTPRVGILRSLGTYGYYPYWHAFLAALGCEAVLSSRSTETTLKQGTAICTAEFCAPVLMSHGHAQAMLARDDLDHVLVPYMLREPIPRGFTDAHFCCYVQSHPGVLANNPHLDWGGKMLAPVVQLNARPDQQVEALTSVLGDPLGVSSKDIRAALRVGEAAQKRFNEEALVLGRRAMAWTEEHDSLCIVCVGRPYNTIDPGMTIDLPRKIAEMGYPVLFMDQLPFDLTDVLPEFANMYWHYGQKILAAAAYIARSRRLFGVYFTNFMCGPDSYILTYFKAIMGRAGKPYLSLQFDGHGADAGYLTRVEAALESFHAWGDIPRPDAAAVAGEAVGAHA